MEEHDWISLGEAAKLLGVHPTTVRNWADQGEIPFRRTPGKHRRFQRSMLESWASQRRDKEKPVPNAADAQKIVEIALGRTRFSTTEGELRHHDWYEQFSQDGIEKMRVLGRQLLQALLQHLKDTVPEVEELSAAHELGEAYAELLLHEELTLVQAVRGFMYFDGFLVESVVQMMAPRLSSTPSEWSDLLQQINAFTNEVLVTIISHYQ